MNRRARREGEIPLEPDAGGFPGWLLTPNVRFSNLNPKNRPPEEIRARIRESLGLSCPVEDEERIVDKMIEAARVYARTQTRRAAWIAAKEEPEDRLRNDRDAWQEDLTKTQESIGAAIRQLESEPTEERVTRLWELEKREGDLLVQGAELGEREGMKALHGQEVKQAFEAIRAAVEALEALPAEARALLERELGKRPARPAVLNALDVGFPDIDRASLDLPDAAGALAEYLAERRKASGDGRDDYWSRVVAVRKAKRAAYFSLEGEGGVLSGLEAAQRILWGRFNPAGKDRLTGGGKPDEGTVSFVHAVTLAASELLGGKLPSHSRTNALLRIFDDRNHMATVKNVRANMAAQAEADAKD